MFQVIGSAWPLFVGMFMLMIGNGLQGTLLGVRGGIEGFSPQEMSVVMSAYFVGFLFASRMAPRMIQRVGHVRLFAALGSTISAVLILYPALTEVWAWTAGRVIIGFCFCGVYITAESWLNDASTNATRGKALSLYMIVQTAGISIAQYILTLGDISGFILFIIPSVLVSLAFAPILLSVNPAPEFSTTKPLPLKALVEASPLACMGMFLLGGVYAAQFGMSAVYGTQAGLSVGQISLFVTATYVTALVLQYPIGWVSDRIDRRVLILALAAIGSAGALVPLIFIGQFWAIVLAGAIAGGTSNPLYALLIAYGNDYIAREDMAAASGGFLFINGVGAILGPLAIGWLMGWGGAQMFWAVIAVLMGGLAAYAAWRMTRRERDDTIVAESVSYAPIPVAASSYVAEVAQEIYADEIGQQDGARAGID
ncbi:MFS transporter [Wenxinia saemankumensis]|uniref:Predicted arabinose efflux permease, MFS family n=1 Tax=Wenxinia saemankumensis TaxID=1447782 RepID=A0A1M6GQK5_9RHOB|nr:MFS transporter [Wenxinia saemankumensis]SHJ12254.1 Predicted arabinose efflux permease, MFS family [Wenxinia saemankumensis]